MKDVRIVMLIVGILVAGIAFNSVAQSKQKKAEKAFYKRSYHEPKHVKTDFKNKKEFKSSKANKTKENKSKSKAYGKQKMHKDHKLRPYARRNDD